MSQIVMPMHIPVEDNFLRRECPYCYREFKILLSEDEREALIKRFSDSFWVKPQELPEDEVGEEGVEEFTCPYCGQKANKDSWWTQEQLAYARVFAENIMADTVNDWLDDMKRTIGRSSGGVISFKVNKKMKKKEPWISPETNDMKVVDLPCCDRKMKVADDFSGTAYCFFCGFPYQVEA